MNKVIRNHIDYEEALLALEKMMDCDPDIGTSEADELELLSLLIQDFESRSYKFVPPNPIEAIKFRMEQENLTPRDLIPYIGSRSKVSEVLSGKRPLTMSMIRALHSGLRIPANVLIQEQNANEETEIIDWDKFPIKQMIDWGWIASPQHPSSLNAEELLRPLFAGAGSLRPQSILLRSSNHIRSARSMDEYALRAWAARVLALASKNPVEVQYKPGTLTIEFLREVTHLSISDTGPLIARDFLRERGIQIIIERYLPRTYLDGAAIIVSKLNPVVGLTLRYDRIDNFWFTLMHELAHLALHLDSESSIYFDDLDIDAEEDPRESEANQLAGEALIPQEAWSKSPASRLRMPEAAEHLAKQLNIHPAIVAGRMQHEFKAYQLLSNLVGHHKVRELFPETNWR
ncbi:MAG: ImmA/IrrE family metallo-endopeptidase [Dehalococcoidales bacterium]|nr:ImmA/IrrE family metallo-endopeptidase [Dehalococcoidales bacterium]